MQNKLSKDELETIYRVDAVTQDCLADSSVPKDIHRMQKQGWTCLEMQYYPDGSVMAAKFKAPRKSLSIGKAVKTKRVMTEAQRMAAAERMRNMKHNK